MWYPAHWSEEGGPGGAGQEARRRGRATPAGPEVASGEGPWPRGGRRLRTCMSTGVGFSPGPGSCEHSLGLSHQCLPCVHTGAEKPGPLCLLCDFGFQKEWFWHHPQCTSDQHKNSACFHDAHTDTNACEGCWHPRQCLTTQRWMHWGFAHQNRAPRCLKAGLERAL